MQGVGELERARVPLRAHGDPAGRAADEHRCDREAQLVDQVARHERTEKCGPALAQHAVQPAAGELGQHEVRGEPVERDNLTTRGREILGGARVVMRRM